MPAKRHSEPERAAAVTLARSMGADATAELLGIDRKTVRSWLAKAPEPNDADAWRAAQGLAQQQLLSQLATGKVKSPSMRSIVAGVAARNLAYIARTGRNAQDQPEPATADPIREAINRLDPDRKRYMRYEIDL